MNKYRELAELLLQQTQWASAIDTDTREDSTAESTTISSRRLYFNQLLDRRIQSIETIDDLIQLFSLLSAATPIFVDVGKSIPPGQSVMPTNAQWLFYGRKVGLLEEELLRLLGALSSATVQSVETLYGFDGNTVRKLGGRGLNRKSAVNHTVVEIWLSGEVTDEPALQTAISELLAYSDLLLDAAEPSVRGSYYQTFKFLGLVSRYSERVLQSLCSALRSNATRYQIEAAKSLSDIIEKHESAIIRVDHMIAIKVTRNGKVRSLITVLPPAVQAALQSDPTLIRKPEQLLRLLGNASAATPISSARRVSKGD
jgi:hypothetical protein